MNAPVRSFSDAGGFSADRFQAIWTRIADVVEDRVGRPEPVTHRPAEAARPGEPGR